MKMRIWMGGLAAAGALCFGAACGGDDVDTTSTTGDAGAGGTTTGANTGGSSTGGAGGTSSTGGAGGSGGSVPDCATSCIQAITDKMALCEDA